MTPATDEADVTATPVDNCDVFVVGGGPAGAAVAILLAEGGLDVVMAERERHPRFHVGESLLPHSLPILERFGVIDQVREIGQLKPGAEFVSQDGATNPVFWFDNALTDGPDHAYQVRRADFDKILFDRARDLGVRCYEGTTATVKVCDDTAVTIATETDDGGKARYDAGLLVDASGRSTITARMWNDRHVDRRHNVAAIFGHFSGVPRLGGRRAGNIRIHLTNPGWMWQIPLTDGVTSVGMVTSGERIAGRKGSIESFFHQHVAGNPEVARLLSDAEPIGQMRTTGNFSYSASRVVGPGFVRVGDAYGFIDPIFSTGVHLAFLAAEEAAHAILTARREPKRRNQLFAAYERSVQRRARYISWFIYSFDDPAFRELLLNPRNVLGVERAIISLLAGDFRQDLRLTSRIQLFKAIRWLMQRKERGSLRRVPAWPTTSNRT
ncbi:MAG: tryptophan 7-halogenase [Pseudomonadota bacterium]